MTIEAALQLALVIKKALHVLEEFLGSLRGSNGH